MADTPTGGPLSDLSIPPTDKIIAMRTQGLSNNQIIQSLQREGYESGIILDGMNQADFKQKIEGAPPAPSEEIVPEMRNPMQFNPGAPAPQQAQTAPLAQEQNNIPPMGGMPPPMQGAASSPNSDVVEQISIERIEEIAEAIIDEKWNEIVRSINKIIEWKERTEANINKLEQKFEDMRKEFDTLTNGVLGKIGEYDKNLDNIGVEIKAMEKVFQKIIPSLTENVHSLNEITKKMENNVSGGEKKTPQDYIDGNY